MDLSIVIPCFNEVENVPLLQSELMPVVRALRLGRSVEVVFVDDGSTDGTGDLLERQLGDDDAVRVVRHGANRGLGAAHKTAFRQAKGETIVVTDSDASYPFSLIPRLLDRLLPGVDVVTASCYHPAGGVENVPGYRLLLSRSASFLYRLLIDRRIHTYTCMFRAYRRRVVDTVSFDSDGFLGVTELLARSLLSGFIVEEFPCTLRARRRGASKARVLRIIRSHLRLQAQLLWSRVSLKPMAATGQERRH